MYFHSCIVIELEEHHILSSYRHLSVHGHNVMSFRYQQQSVFFSVFDNVEHRNKQ